MSFPITCDYCKLRLELERNKKLDLLFDMVDLWDVIDECDNLCECEEDEEEEEEEEEEELIEPIDYDATNKMMPEIDFSDLEYTYDERIKKGLEKPIIEMDYRNLDKQCDETIEESKKETKKKVGRPSKNFNSKEWRKNNKDKVNKYGSARVKCDVCDIELRYDSLNQHFKSAKHLKNVGN